MLRNKSILRFDDIFKIEDGIAVPKSSKETLIPEVREIIVRSKPIPGDSDGRKKLYAYKELLAVYLMADNRSHARKEGLRDQHLINRVIDICKLEPTWKPDDVVMSCVKMYKDTLENDEISIRVLGDTIDSLKLASNLLVKINNELRIELENQGTSWGKLTEIANNITAVLSLSNKVTDEIERLSNIKLKVATYERNVKLARGNIEVTLSMQPEN